MHPIRMIAGSAILLALSVSPSLAQKTSKEEIAMNNFIHEHATCAAYYVIGSQCIGNRPDAESQALSTRLMQIGVNAAHRANQYGDVLESR